MQSEQEGGVGGGVGIWPTALLSLARPEDYLCFLQYAARLLTEKAFGTYHWALGYSL